MTTTATTLRLYPELIQGSDEWLAARCGILTASTIGKLITPTLKVAANDTSRDLTISLAAERITGHVDPTFRSDDMWRGVLEEPIARDYYTEHCAPVTEIGFMVRDDNGIRLGYSPDGPDLLAVLLKKSVGNYLDALSRHRDEVMQMRSTLTEAQRIGIAVMRARKEGRKVVRIADLMDTTTCPKSVATLGPEDRKLVRARVAQRWTDADGKPLYRINDSGNICRTRQITTKKKYAIKERDEYRCQSCGRHDPTGGALQVDHIIAYRLGGSDHPSNLQTLCKPCHVEKERQSRRVAHSTRNIRKGAKWDDEVLSNAE